LKVLKACPTPMKGLLREASRVDGDIDGDTQVFGHARFIEFKGCSKITVIYGIVFLIFLDGDRGEFFS